MSFGFLCTNSHLQGTRERERGREGERQRERREGGREGGRGREGEREREELVSALRPERVFNLLIIGRNLPPSLYSHFWHGEPLF